MSQRRVHGLKVALDHRISALFVGFLNALFDVCDGLLFWQDATEREEAGLHDGIDASSHVSLLGDLVRIDHVEMQVFVQESLLNLAGQVCPDLVGAIDAIEQKRTAGTGVL